MFTGTDFNPERSYDEGAHARPATGKVPDYVTMDKLVARFYAHFFQDRNWDREGPLGEPELEREICRLVTIQYYIYDNEVQILEPKITNAGASRCCCICSTLPSCRSASSELTPCTSAPYALGMPHGTFYKKAPLLKEDGTPLVLRDLIVGGDIKMLGQEFFITDADEFTRKFFRLAQ